ncbi:hypothetical protein AB832_00865 [Flavobacteriaceae bacterium (ex Bugula neritina AB1)]|nr:hypothetical protein AB832_00865 [Flavobacteriaceae bacterium (ex Bugula neritina AB1)]
MKLLKKITKIIILLFFTLTACEAEDALGLPINKNATQESFKKSNSITYTVEPAVSNHRINQLFTSLLLKEIGTSIWVLNSFDPNDADSFLFSFQFVSSNSLNTDFVLLRSTSSGRYLSYDESNNELRLVSLPSPPETFSGGSLFEQCLWKIQGGPSLELIALSTLNDPSIYLDIGNTQTVGITTNEKDAFFSIWPILTRAFN